MAPRRGHVSVLALVFAVVASACSPAVYTWPNKYRPRYHPGDDAAQDSGPLRVYFTAETGSLIRPAMVKFTGQIHGDYSACRWVVWAIAGGTVSRDTMCNRAESREYPVKCVGDCVSYFAVYDRNMKELDRSSVTIHVAGGEN